ncbi:MULTISPECIES: sarcosine oxidase subunit gamma family protein [Arthrobacter]|uniref:Sarcosine oxidase subunit gamma family protein n=2 Tax=Arthrobacter TaxID=1663 RepID=A0ABU9KFF8_9MICC|nr:sarcosine oxidase subunit gamma family protein [Arthrobacter sp. YJM1]MDP5225607.1 sarcosine oxidase subunit gamma family protein [Arthrobacter sp. YJM1]
MAETISEETLSLAASLRRSPAARLAKAFAVAGTEGERGVRLREIPFLTQLGIRATPGTPAAAAVEAALGAPLPAIHGSTTTGGGYSVLWIGPDEFLAVGDEGSADLDRGPAETARVAATLGEAGSRLPGAVVDLSANRTTFELSGPAARLVLEKGVSFDLHPRSFRAGQAIVTVLDHVPVLVWKTEEETFRVLPRASFADHVGRWLLDAMREFSAPEVH